MSRIGGLASPYVADLVSTVVLHVTYRRTGLALCSRPGQYTVVVCRVYVGTASRPAADSIEWLQTPFCHPYLARGVECLLHLQRNLGFVAVNVAVIGACDAVITILPYNCISITRPSHV